MHCELELSPNAQAVFNHVPQWLHSAQNTVEAWQSTGSLALHNWHTLPSLLSVSQSESSQNRAGSWWVLCGRSDSVRSSVRSSVSLELDSSGCARSFLFLSRDWVDPFCLNSCCSFFLCLSSSLSFFCFSFSSFLRSRSSLWAFFNSSASFCFVSFSLIISTYFFSQHSGLLYPPSLLLALRVTLWSVEMSARWVGTIPAATSGLHIPLVWSWVEEE